MFVLYLEKGSLKIVFKVDEKSVNDIFVSHMKSST